MKIKHLTNETFTVNENPFATTEQSGNNIVTTQINTIMEERQNAFEEATADLQSGNRNTNNRNTDNSSNSYMNAFDDSSST